MSNEPEWDVRPGGPLFVELLARNPIKLDWSAIVQSIKRRRPDFEGEPGNELMMGHFPGLQTQFKDGAAPMQVMVALPDADKAKPTPNEAALQQTWDWDAAAEVIASCEYTAMVNDMMSSGVEPPHRLDALLHVLDAMLEVHDVDAIYWPSSERYVNPASYRQARADCAGFFEGPVNVRLFRIDNGQQGECVMDSLGMANFFLPDVQCHFMGLDAQQVASQLFNIANYLFENGDVIEDGHTVEGLSADQKWPCRHEESLVKPKRVVLDMNPEPFSPPR